ncbi:protein-glutamate O-methyltransferase CheR [Glaciecola sp. MH2013]|uniref:CheR family methyltransferase n=1 Tax=Glaciecola sp. MH2013 TaxID=2785524 RepID=UPI00189E8ED8|nr:protein-glutamate O-methyltransferase CheR [Glaciecola sp. MH2013]MBF7072324.1 protein-glutamate O-methyltransferase CheR [Glaciecola sp. MH2013]
MNKELSATLYDKFCHFLHTKSGIVLGDAKQYLVRSRMVPLMHRFEFNDIDKLISMVIGQTNTGLTQAALEAMTTNETLWFRDKYPFDILQDTLLPELSKKQNRIRIWSAASSTGQEAYSIAITLAEFQKKHPGAFSHGVEIVGTDLSTEVVTKAKAAIYDELSLKRGLTEYFKKHYFEPASGSSMRVSQALRDWVSFRSFNLTQSFASLGKFDIVFCRNVLIYFDVERKDKILQDISASLHDNGSLILGASESLGGASKKFTMVTQASGLYYRKV